MANPFPVRLRAASITPRWSIIHTLKPDHVSSHSFFVAVYAARIARLINWSGNTATLLWGALIHDLDELITGDLVSPVKRNIIDPTNLSRFVDRKMNEILPDFPGQLRSTTPQLDELRLIIKAADQLDALLYAIGEQVLGNGIIAARIPSCEVKLCEAWYKLPADPSKLAELWIDVVVPAINEHRDPLRYDIGK